MADKLHVEIVTVEGRRYKGDADFGVAPGAVGELGLLPRHRTLLTPVAPGRRPTDPWRRVHVVDLPEAGQAAPASLDAEQGTGC